MERAFLNARRRILASYRVFDPTTRLRSREGRAVGHDWFDLIVHVLRKGVEIDLVISDFDPILAHELHCETWSAKRVLIAAAEVAGQGARLRVTAAPHAARAGPGAAAPLLGAHSPASAAETGGAERPARPRKRARPRLQPGPLAARPRRRGWPPLRPLAPAARPHPRLAPPEDRGFRRRPPVHRRAGPRRTPLRRQGAPPAARRDMARRAADVSGSGGRGSTSASRDVPRVGAGKRPPPPAETLLTTVSRRRRRPILSLSPQPVRSTISAAHHRLARDARQLVYLETQYFRSRPFARTLAEAARDNPNLGLILILPAAPEDVAFFSASSPDARLGEYLQARALDIVREAFGDRLAVLSPVRPAAFDTDGRDTLEGSPIIYVHAKVSIFDERPGHRLVRQPQRPKLRVGHGGGRPARRREAEVRRLRARVFRHWLGSDAGRRSTTPAPRPRPGPNARAGTPPCAPEDAGRAFCSP